MFLEHLDKAFHSGKLQFFNSLEGLRDRREFARYLAPVRKAAWVVYAKPPFAGPQQVLDYVGRYTHRVAICNHRLLDIEAGQVRFQWKDYRHDNKQKTMTLSAEEFIRRFLLRRESRMALCHLVDHSVPRIPRPAAKVAQVRRRPQAEVRRH